MKLRLIPDRLCVCRLPANSPVPRWAAGPGFWSITSTARELSIVCAEDRVSHATAEGGWAAFELEGPIPFSTTGVLSSLASAIADRGISLFAISTYDTDYILVKRERVADAASALRDAGHDVVVDI